MKRTVKAWDVVGDQFEALTAHLRSRFDSATAEVGAERKALAKALVGLSSAMEDALLTVGKTVRDPVVRRDVTSTITSMRAALGTTIDELGDEVRARLPKVEIVTPKPVAAPTKTVSKKTAARKTTARAAGKRTTAA